MHNRVEYPDFSQCRLQFLGSN